MAGFVSKGNNIYDGTLKVKTAAVKVGTFVLPDYTNKECAAPADNTKIALFVANEIDTADEQMIDDVDYEVKVGKLVKGKRLLPGEEIVTTEANSTAPEKGDVVDVGAGVITKTSGTPAQTFTVTEIYTWGGVPAYRCIVNN